MTTTLTRSERFEAAETAVRDVMRKAVESHKARKVDLRSDSDYRSWRTMQLGCVLVVKHQDRGASIQCSRDGSAAGHIFLPTKLCIVQPDSVGEFLLICVPKWLARKTLLSGVTRDLTEDRVWTKADLEAWETLRKTRLTVNSKIYTANKTGRTSSNISRSNAA